MTNKSILSEVVEILVGRLSFYTFQLLGRKLKGLSDIHLIEEGSETLKQSKERINRDSNDYIHLLRVPSEYNVDDYIATCTTEVTLNLPYYHEFGSTVVHPDDVFRKNWSTTSVPLSSINTAAADNDNGANLVIQQSTVLYSEEVKAISLLQNVIDAITEEKKKQTVCDKYLSHFTLPDDRQQNASPTSLYNNTPHQQNHYPQITEGNINEEYRPAVLGYKSVQFKDLIPPNTTRLMLISTTPGITDMGGDKFEMKTSSFSKKHTSL
ncbi:hypothetical protein BDA99DRAFT_555438 [Phascolomyces articulosus]|uniref:Uncharacterized protein n=1 Tax=Phascolomyces articulosus TaxID=60185 RepID=A0AAD5KMR4_9FUNG|nr:hypothetical protein BDA99DRAFT_555438 [Phascolomyces articulosus]